ncbi:uncharacterized protein LOC111128733 isoform X2 [Crassostrea virginica]
MPKSKRASTTSNPIASVPKAKRKRHPPSDGRQIPKAQDTVPLLPPHLNTDSEAPSVTPADNAVSPSQGISMHSVSVLQTQPSLPIMANCTQLSLVDKATRHKIVSGEYVHLGALLVRDPTKSQASTLSLDTQGQLVAQPKSLAKIASTDNWTEAFLIFASIYLEAHPDRTQQILKYMHDIRLGAETSKGWVVYDEQYRLKMSISPFNNWGVIDSELWLVYMTPKPAAVQSKPQSLGTNLKCFDYNYRAACQRTSCPYLHRCLKCNNINPAIHCFNSQPTFNQNPSNVQPHFREAPNQKILFRPPFSPPPKGNFPQNKVRELAYLLCVVRTPVNC